MENQTPITNTENISETTNTENTSETSNPVLNGIIYLVLFFTAYYLLSAFGEWEAKRMYKRQYDYVNTK